GGSFTFSAIIAFACFTKPTTSRVAGLSDDLPPLAVIVMNAVASAFQAHVRERAQWHEPTRRRAYQQRAYGLGIAPRGGVQQHAELWRTIPFVDRRDSGTGVGGRH